MAFTPKTWANDAAGATPITAAELQRMEQGIVDGQNPLFAVLTADYASTVISVAGVTGLQITLAASTRYLVRLLGLYTAAVTTTGCTIGLAGTAQAGLTGISVGLGLQSSNSAVSRFQITTSTGTATVGSSSALIPGTAEMLGVFTTGATGGTFMPSFATEVAASVATLLAGTYIEARAI